MFVPTAAVSKLAGPEPSSVTLPTGLPFKPERVAVVVLLKVLSTTPGNTYMNCVSVAPVVKVNFVR